MNDDGLPTPAQARRLLFTVDYRGPWERLEGFFFGVRKDNTLRWEIGENPSGLLALLGRLGDWANRKDIAWRNRHIASGTRPRKIWRRRG